MAEALELSEDVVRQRLSRGRQLLQKQVLSFVEGALGRGGPGKVFTLAVLAAIPVAAGSASAATLGAATIKAGIAKSAGASVLSLLVGPVTGLAASYFGIQTGLATARTEGERKAVLHHVLPLLFGCVLFIAGIWALAVSRRFWDGHATAFVASLTGSLAWAAWLVGNATRATSGARQVRAAERRLHPEAFKSDPFEYRSRMTIFGVLWFICASPRRPRAHRPPSASSPSATAQSA